MLKSPLLFAVSVLVTLFSWTASAKAAEQSIGLDFGLPPMSHAVGSAAQKPAIAQFAASTITLPKKTASSVTIKPVQHSVEQLSKLEQPLPPIEESTVTSPSVESSVNSSATDSTDSGVAEIGIQFQKDAIELPDQVVEERTAALSDGIGFWAAGAMAKPFQKKIAIEDVEPSQTDSTQAEANSAKLSYSEIGLDDWIFEGGSTSLVAHTVGSAEGTRYWDGKRTKAYYGHTDPGNGVWNLGTFSYQHEAHSPEDADERQLKRLKYQGVQLEEMAKAEGVQLSLVEKLNGLDLANQAPIAALGKGGYIERLAQARRLELENEEAIVWARTRAYLDPDTRAWNAPGLGNTLHSISKDQERRMSAIAKALQAYSPAGAQAIALNQLDAISLEKSDLSVSSLSSHSDDIAVQFELSERDISQSLDEANSALSETSLADELASTDAITIEAIDEQLLPTNTAVASYISGLDMAAEIGFSLPSASELTETVVESAGLADEVAVANEIAMAEPASSVSQTDNQASVELNNELNTKLDTSAPNRAAESEGAIAREFERTEAQENSSNGLSFASDETIDIETLKAGITNPQPVIETLRGRPAEGIRTPVLPVLAEPNEVALQATSVESPEESEPLIVSTDQDSPLIEASPVNSTINAQSTQESIANERLGQNNNAIIDAPEEAVELETEIAIPAPLKSEATRGDRSAPNRSWWRTEDKVVRRK